MRQPDLTDAEVIAAWQTRVRRFVAAERQAKRIALIVIAGIGLLVVVAWLWLRGEAFYITVTCAFALWLAGIPALQLFATTMSRRLTCPRCGESPFSGAFSQSAVRDLDVDTCASCLAPLTEFSPARKSIQERLAREAVAGFQRTAPNHGIEK
jgi:hypothetical protein